MNRLNEIRQRIQNASPGPWTWGEGWSDIQGKRTYDNFDIDKYGDVALYSREDAILPLYIDHYEMMWDDKYYTTRPEDRELIAHAREDIEYLLNVIDELMARGR